MRPWLLGTFSLPADFATDRRYDRLLRVARLAAELAKMELSARADTSISASDDLVRLEDGRGEPIYLDVPITRAQLDALVEPLVARTVDLSRTIVDAAGYGLSDISRVVLIGCAIAGPTLAIDPAYDGSRAKIKQSSHRTARLASLNRRHDALTQIH